MVRYLGAGAMGTVYEVVHEITKRRLALKVMSSELTRDDDASARFLREAQLASELRHPNVVEVSDAGHDDENELLYMVMELLEGSDLHQKLHDARTSRAEMVRWLYAILPALELAHSRGIVHRDLKPENVFLATDESGAECVKLVDFGIARSLHGKGVTATGATMGTPLYMSPEQALKPELVDHRTDLWAFGVMLYEALAGVPPFDDDSPVVLLMRAAAEPHPPLSGRAPGLDPRLEALVDSCLAKEREQRIGSATEIRQALKAVLEDPAVTDRLTTQSVTATVAFSTTGSGPSEPMRLAETALARVSGTAQLAATQPAQAPTRGRGALAAGVSLAVLGLALAAAAFAFWSDEPEPEPTPTAAAEPATPEEPVQEPAEGAPLPSTTTVATEEPAVLEDEAPAPAAAQTRTTRRRTRATSESEPETEASEAEPSEAEPEPTPEAEPEPEAEPREAPVAARPEPSEPETASAEPEARPRRRRRRRRRRPSSSSSSTPPPFSF